MRRGGGPHRPFWWPENEPWPPRDGSHPARRFGRRILLFGVLLFFFVFGLSAIAGAVVSPAREEGPPPFIGGLFLTIVAIVGIAIAGRAARRFARPITEVMEAVERLGSGDYATRVAPGGAPEMRALGHSVNAMAARLAEGEEQRRALVADVAHELRTPLSVIRGRVEGVLDGVYPPEAEQLAPILEEIRVIARLADDLQTYSSAEAHMLQLHPEPASLAALVEEVVDAFQGVATARGVHLVARCDEVAPLTVDAVRLREVLENIVGNALRHTPEGGLVEVTLAPRDGGAAVAVRDTGAGIAPEDLPYVFERYRKAADSTGSGLGLAIARRLVEAHGGTIEAASAPGAGTTMTFWVPGGVGA